MVDLTSKRFGFHDLLNIMEELRGPKGCPWDAEQTHQSIRRDFLEEVYEAVEAIDNGDSAALCEELGDVLLQVVFHASLGASEQAFDMGDVVDGICRKLIYRHPHVFGDASAQTAQDVLVAWDSLKRAEKGQDTYRSTMEQVAKSLPALMYAEKIQKKAKKSGFDWPDISGALDKVREETVELEEAIALGQGAEEELGDLLFATVNVARFMGSDPEQALLGATAKFVRRFSSMEKAATRPLETMSLDEMDKLWNAAKATECQSEG